MTEARIYSQGYRRYEGARTGTAGAVRALITHSIRQALGLGLLGRHKVLPFAIIAMAYLPVAGFIGFAALVPAGAEDFLPTYPQYYGLVTAPLYLLAGVIAPNLLCSDRRTGMLGLYLASPLTRTRYLVAKAAAIVALILAVTLGPPLLMLIAYSLQDLGPESTGQWFITLWRVVVSSLVVGLPYVAVAAAISSFTDRRAVASAATLALITTSAPMTEIMVSEADLWPALRLGNVLFLPQALVLRLFETNEGWARADNPTWSLWMAWFGWVAGGIAIVWYRYRSIEVTR